MCIRIGLVVLPSQHARIGDITLLAINMGMPAIYTHFVRVVGSDSPRHDTGLRIDLGGPINDFSDIYYIQFFDANAITVLYTTVAGTNILCRAVRTVKLRTPLTVTVII